MTGAIDCPSLVFASSGFVVDSNPVGMLPEFVLTVVFVTAVLVFVFAFGAGSPQPVRLNKQTEIMINNIAFDTRINLLLGNLIK
jgi:hypothetical protein